MQITRGKIQKPIKTLIYGPEGIGKTTLASQFPDPLFIDTEGSTAHIDVARLPAPTSWIMLLQEVEYVKQNPDVCKTLVIDTADWAEKLCAEDICAQKKIDGLEGLGYGKAYVYVRESFGKLLNLLNDVLERGINVVMTAHAQMRKFEQPDELGAYDRWELKMMKQTAPLAKEWADMILFCNYKTMVVNVDGKGALKGKNKAQGGRRVMFTSHHPCWDAKNRFGLPEELEMKFENIAHIIPAKGSSVPAVAPEPVMPAEGEPKQMTLTDLTPAAGQTSPPPDEDPRQPAEVAEKDEKAAPAVNPYFSDPAKLPKALKDLMEADGICEWDIQQAVLAKGYYPENTLIQNMDPEFITGWIIAFWPQVKALIAEIKEKEYIPFN